MANYGLLARSGSLPIFVNNFLLEYRLIHLSAVAFVLQLAEVSSCISHSSGPQSLKYFLPSPLLKKFANSAFRFLSLLESVLILTLLFPYFLYHANGDVRIGVRRKFSLSGWQILLIGFVDIDPIKQCDYNMTISQHVQPKSHSFKKSRLHVSPRLSSPGR